MAATLINKGSVLLEYHRAIKKVDKSLFLGYISLSLLSNVIARTAMVRARRERRRCDERAMLSEKSQLGRR